MEGNDNLSPQEDANVIVETSEIMANILADPSDIIVDNLSEASEYFEQPEQAAVGEKAEEKPPVEEPSDFDSSTPVASNPESSSEAPEVLKSEAPEVQSPVTSENISEQPEAIPSAGTPSSEPASEAEDVQAAPQEVLSNAEEPVVEQATDNTQQSELPIVESDQKAGDIISPPPPYQILPESLISESTDINQLDQDMDKSTSLYPTEALFDVKKDADLSVVTEEGVEEKTDVYEGVEEEKLPSPEDTTERSRKRLYAIMAALIVTIIIIVIVGISFFNSDDDIDPFNNGNANGNSSSSSSDSSGSIEASTLLGNTFEYLKGSTVARVVGVMFMSTMAFAIGFMIYITTLRAKIAPISLV